MGTIPASAIAAEAATLLVDPDMITWVSAEHLVNINAGQAQIAQIKPEASIVTGVVSLVEGIQQALPAGGFLLGNVYWNMGNDGATPGDTVYLADMARFSAGNPSWPSADAAATVQAVMYDPKNPSVFFVSPPQPAVLQGSVLMAYSAPPADVSTIDDPITIENIYAQALMYYDLARCFIKGTAPNSAAKSQTCWNLFVTSLDRQDLAESKADVNALKKRLGV